MAASAMPLPARLWRAPATRVSVMRAFQRLARMAKIAFVVAHMRLGGSIRG